MYGAMDSEEDIPLNDKGGVAVVNMEDQFDPKAFLKNPFGETFNADFWNEVCDLYGNGEEMEWEVALNRTRIKHIKETYTLLKKDPLVALITDVFDKFSENVTDDQIMSSFKQQLSAFAQLLLVEDKETKHYTVLLPIPGEHYMKTVLHLAAERNLLDICAIFVKIYPNGVYVTTNEDKMRLPIEFSLENRLDNTASFLANNMLHERVRGLFLADDVFDARFKMADFIEDPNMTKTVVALLECCINTDWPFTPVKDGERKEVAWDRMPDTSLRYHFHYRLLDGDQNSEPPIMENGEANNNFNHKQASCLQLLASSPHSQVTMYHPVVRKLVDRKWQNFGRRTIRMRCLWYIIFLAFLSVALFALEDETSKPVKILRHVCEVVTILFVFGYIVNEVDEMEKERLAYWKDLYNYLDLIGLVLVLVIIPLRFTNRKAESGVAAVAYLVNCLRVFKYFPAFKVIGIYSKTFANIIYYDMSKFALIFVIVLLAFGGSIFLSTRATGITSFTLKQIFLKETRALAEGNPFADDYDALNDGVTFLIMVNMLVIIVILANILIGQLSYRYEVAMLEAGTQYSIDKTKFICRLENNRFRKFNSRIEYYMDGDYVSEEARVKVLLSDWAAKKEEVGL